MKENIQGNIQVRISEDEMIAYLDYKQSQVLTEWSDNIISGLLKNAGVTKGFKKFHFNRIYKKIERTFKDESFIIARGQEPQSRSSARFDFTFPRLSTSLESIYSKLADDFGKPTVFPVTEELFIDDNPEQVSNVTLKVGYVTEGDKVAKVIDEPKPQAGFTVTGRQIEPDTDDVTFCVSKDFSIEKGYIVAQKSGFIRKGKIWIDIVPFKGHKIVLSNSEDFSEYYLSFIPGSKDAPDPNYEDIINLFLDVEYPLELLKDEEVIINLLKKAISDGKGIKFSLIKPRKSVAKIEINQNKTKATLILRKGAGPGNSLSMRKVGDLIRESKIKGMNLDTLKKVILDFHKNKKLDLNITILEGKAATRGEPRKLKYQKEFISMDKIQGIIDRIDEDIEAFYPSFKEFSKDDISSGILVSEGMEFALLTDPVDGNDGTDIYGKKIPGLVGNDPIIKTYENISVKQSKYIANIDGLLDIGEVNGETLLRVREHKDMFTDISVSKDAMSAHFTFYKEEGSGEPASIEFISKQVEDAGVVKGINENVISDSFNKYQNGELISEVEFAHGRVPSDKISSRIKYFHHSENKAFSYEIEKGVNIAQIFPEQNDSEDGFDVFGTLMESSGVASLKIDVGDEILQEIQSDGSTLLKSGICGELKVDEKSIKIIDKKVLGSDVSIKTGSIKTLCSLVVKGSVMSSYYVVSGGNIKVQGTVQGALISADKNVIISQGVKGEGKAVLRAKEKVDVKFIENGNILAVDDVHIRKAALQAKIISNGKIIFDKGGSKVIAGEMLCRKGMAVDEIGSVSGNKTIISFGQDYLVADKIKVFESDVDKIQQDLMKIDHILHKPSGHISTEKVAHLRKQKVFLMKKLDKKNMKLFLLREKFEEHTDSEILVRNKIYPGVIFESHGRRLEIVEEEPKCRIKFNPRTGQIEKVYS